jgi:hypothetical protein
MTSEVHVDKTSDYERKLLHALQHTPPPLLMKSWQAIAYCKRPPDRQGGLISWARLTNMDLAEAERLRILGELLMASKMEGRRRFLMVYTDLKLVPHTDGERMQLARPYQQDRFGNTRQRHAGFYSGRRGKGYTPQKEESNE